jgi:uncharacterized protein YqeY
MTDDLRRRLQDALVPAMRARDRAAVSAIRSALAAVANAEAVPVEPRGNPPTAGPVAKSAVGLGAAEVARLELSEDDVRSILHAEVTAHLEAADHLRSVGQAARAVELQAQVAALRPFLDTIKD